MRGSRARLLQLGRTLALSLAVAPMATFAHAQEPVACAKADFELVVDQAAAALRDLNNKNRPLFQEKLRALKDKRGWTNDQFMAEAAPFVKDDEIEVFDDKTNLLLNKISEMGQEGATAKVADCALLKDLNGLMSTLVETQTSKWTYMFQKLETALSN